MGTRRGEPEGAAARAAFGAKILVIDDDYQIRNAVRRALEAEGYRVETAHDGASGLERIQFWLPDVVVLDRNLPDMDGLEVCRLTDAAERRVSIIVLSVYGDGKDKVLSLRSGAYDHLEKPFDMDELIERIRVGLRHLSGATDSCFRSGELVLDFDRAQVTVRGEAVRLAPKEFDLLKYLAQHSDRLVTNEVLLRNVWGVGYEDNVASLRVFVHNIRKKVEQNPSRPRYLLTIQGHGYRLAVLPVGQGVPVQE